MHVTTIPVVVTQFLLLLKASTAWIMSSPPPLGSCTRLYSTVDVNDGTPQLTFLGQDADDELQSKGDWEQSLMALHQSPLQATKPRGGGFGSNTKNFKEQAQQYTQVLREEGIVRIDNVLTNSLATKLKEYLVDLRKRATDQVKEGSLQLQDRFADVLHNKNRCDLKIPLGPSEVNNALHHVLSKTAIKDVICEMFSTQSDGTDAVLWELNCFMSNSGSRRQLVHPDQSCETTLKEPAMLTCFVALQDVDETMGPTNFIPRTHFPEVHNQFFTDKASVLGEFPTALGTLPKGSCAIFDPRLLHCAGANTCDDPNNTRALFYFSFKNPIVQHPGCPSCSGYGIEEAELSIEELSKELAAAKKKKKKGTATTRLDELACFP